MMHRIHRNWLLRVMGLSCLVWSSCKDREIVYSYDKVVILNDVAQSQILPNLVSFIIEADSLASTVSAFVQQPDSSTLATARTQWIRANLQWKACETFDFGPVMDSHIHSRIGKWPTDAGIIDTKISSGEPMDAAFFEGLGATARGLPAIEYLLFRSTATLAYFTTDSLAQEHRTYVQGLAENLTSKAREVHSIWADDYARDFTHSTATGLQDPMGLLVNALISTLEEVTKTKIGKPFGKFDLGTVQPDLVESIRANVSLELLRANLVTVQAVYEGGPGTGLDQALDDLHATYGEEPLAPVISQQFEVVLDAVDQITLPLQDALINQHDQVEAAYEALKDLIVLFKTDLCSAMSITVTVSDTDGD